MDNKFKDMDKERKIALIVLGIFSIAVVTILFLNLYGSIRNPLDYEKLAKKNSKNSVATSTNTSKDNLNSDNIELKAKDTDNDGLSDWDELFIYGTSPYLEDTDGDGLSDHEEVVVYKTNPVCPEGQDCIGALVQQDNQNTSSAGDEISGLYDLLNSLEDSSTGTSADSTATSSSASSAIDPTQLRSILLENGFSKEDLDAVSDADLLKIYQEATSEL